MGREMEQQQISNSVSAMKDYLVFREENSGRHKAHVIIHTNGQDTSIGDMFVTAQVRGNTPQIKIEWPVSYSGDCPGKFVASSKTEFKFICGTLQIKSEDVLGCPVTIEVTGK